MKEISTQSRFVFLSNDFYTDYPISNYPEIERKAARPYIQVRVKINGVQFAIPLRSEIRHPHAFWTNKANKSGLDFTKAVVIEKSSHIDYTRSPYIRPDEFKVLKGKDYRIQQKMINYIQLYKEAKKDFTTERNKKLCTFSTLQYFEQYI